MSIKTRGLSAGSEVRSSGAESQPTSPPSSGALDRSVRPCTCMCARACRSVPPSPLVAFGDLFLREDPADLQPHAWCRVSSAARGRRGRAGAVSRIVPLIVARGDPHGLLARFGNGKTMPHVVEGIAKAASVCEFKVAGGEACPAVATRQGRAGQGRPAPAPGAQGRGRRRRRKGMARNIAPLGPRRGLSRMPLDLFWA